MSVSKDGSAAIMSIEVDSHSHPPSDENKTETVHYGKIFPWLLDNITLCLLEVGNVSYLDFFLQEFLILESRLWLSVKWLGRKQFDRSEGAMNLKSCLRPVGGSVVEISVSCQPATMKRETV